MNPEDSKQTTEAEHIRNMTESDGWKIIYPKLSTFILDLQNINNIDMTSLNTLATQLAARKMASDLIYAWLRQDVFGAIETMNMQKGAVETDDDTVLRQ